MSPREATSEDQCSLYSAKKITQSVLCLRRWWKGKCATLATKDWDLNNGSKTLSWWSPSCALQSTMTRRRLTLIAPHIKVNRKNSRSISIKNRHALLQDQCVPAKSNCSRRAPLVFSTRSMELLFRWRGWSCQLCQVTLTLHCCETEVTDFSKLLIKRMVTSGKPLCELGSVIATVHLRGWEKENHALTAFHEAEA